MEEAQFMNGILWYGIQCICDACIHGWFYVIAIYAKSLSDSVINFVNQNQKTDQTFPSTTVLLMAMSVIVTLCALIYVVIIEQFKFKADEEQCSIFLALSLSTNWPEKIYILGSVFNYYDSQALILQ